MSMHARPTRSGVTQTQPSARAATRRPTGPPRARGDEARYPTVGSAALAPAYESDTDEPSRTRTSAEREAADERAARRVASRAAGTASAQSRRRLRVAPPLPVTVARAPFVAMLLVIVVAGVVGILVLNTMINANQFRLNNLQNQQAGLDQQEQQLKQNLAQQESPGSLVAAARKLGLVPAGTLAYIRMPNGTVVGVPQPSTRTPSVTDQTGARPVPSGSAPSGIVPSGSGR